MRTDVFDYELPAALIAQEPAAVRDEARMLVVHRADGRLEHRRVDALPEYLAAGDLLVLNDTRVIPARVMGVKAGTGGRVELLLLEERGPNRWEVLLRASRRPVAGTRIELAGDRVRAVFREELGDGRALVDFELDSAGSLLEELEVIGAPPLPPYIARDPAQMSPASRAADRERYQTVYAREPGAVAAPTAGLHFTPALLDRLAQAGVERAMLTLHVGLGTFRPVSVEQVEAHRMEQERYQIPAATAAGVQAAKTRGDRVVAVGSTSVRTLETAARDHGAVVACEGRSDLFIYPPYRFQVVDAMLTNFHLPRSTLLMMVCALGGTELMLHAYRTAVQERYRFYSYGDCMLIL